MDWKVGARAQSLRTAGYRSQKMKVNPLKKLPF